MHGPAVLCPPLRQTNRSCSIQISKTYLQNLVLSWLVSAPSNKSLNSNQQNLLAKSCLVLACLRSLKQIAQFKSEKPTRKICLGLANQILNIAKFDTSALDLKIVCFYLACLFDIFSWCMRCSLRGVVKQQRIGCFFIFL